MRWFIDTEFMDHGKTIDLISIGMCREDGKTFYAESSEFDAEKCSPWVKQNVIPKLTAFPLGDSLATIRKSIVHIIAQDNEPPEFWGYYADYDWYLFCRLFGGMLSLPPTWPQLCFDLRQEMWRLGLTKANVPPQDPESGHNALADAKWTRNAWQVVNGLWSEIYRVNRGRR